MNIEQHFLQKAIIDKNFVDFLYEAKSYKKVQPLSILNGILKSDKGDFELKDIKKIVVLKEKF